MRRRDLYFFFVRRVKKLLIGIIDDKAYYWNARLSLRFPLGKSSVCDRRKKIYGLVCRRIYSWLITNRLCRSGDRLIIAGLPACCCPKVFFFFSFFHFFVPTMATSLSRLSISSLGASRSLVAIEIWIYFIDDVIECIFSTFQQRKKKRTSKTFLINQTAEESHQTRGL